MSGWAKGKARSCQGMAVAENIFALDLVLKYHWQNFIPVYVALFDVAKTFDSVSHRAIKNVIEMMGLPRPMVLYIMDVTGGVRPVFHVTTGCQMISIW